MDRQVDVTQHRMAIVPGRRVAELYQYGHGP
jgi:hypothetical protein